MQGVEHGSISRPLSGLAQVLESLGNPNLQSFSTTNKGNIVASNDLFSLANMSRIAGAKPLDEAIAIDLGFRTTAYGLEDSKSRQELGAAIKTKVIGGSLPTADDLNSFATEYAARGGQQTEFNKWFMGLYKTANSSQINAMAASLRNPVSQNMQKVMGGYAMKDFTNNGQNQNPTLDSGQ